MSIYLFHEQQLVLCDDAVDWVEMTPGRRAASQSFELSSTSADVRTETLRTGGCSTEVSNGKIS